jgi:hypothetical protein
MFPEKDDITWGGFIRSNIRNSVVKDCLGSGDPSNFFNALQDAIDGIEEEMEYIGEDKFWEQEMHEWNE